ncbi:GLUG motif-containing protein [Lysinibacillus sp. NPDC048646]|uniref:GLUG motif-containing protein n=1 Tax=Lysinibacillus sp. NPDC048646 TaxID=3390574 RepID=UPI003CFCCBD9
MANGLFGGGDGTELSPFIVEDAQDLDAVRNNSSASYKQTKSIDLSVYPNWIPLGDINNNNKFSGSYDGSDLTIDNLTISSTSGSLGLFNNCHSGKIKNVNIKNANISAANFQEVGVLAGTLTNTQITECTVSGKVQVLGFFNTVGGLAGVITGTSVIKQSAVINSEIKGKYVGGFVGNFTGKLIENCYVTGKVTGYSDNGSSQVSGFAENMRYGDIVNCYVSAELTFEHANEYAALQSPFANNQGGTITSCYSDIENKGVEYWKPLFSYSENTIAKGTDDELYRCIRMQDAKDYNAGYPFPPNYPAQPISGQNWATYWQLADIHEARNTAQMQTKSNYVDWDFDNIWTIEEGKSYPIFKLKRAIKKCTRVPLTNYRR